MAVTVTSPDLARAEASPPTVARPGESALTWRSYFRGRFASRDTPVSLLAVAESTRHWQPPPAGAAVAVRAGSGLIEKHGVAQGALAVVLDCSGSMGPPRGKPMTETTRYRLVLRALRRMLARVPRGTSVSIWVFGQAVSPRNTVADAESTIRQAQPPVTWTARPEQLATVMRSVEGLQPWNESPIVRTMIRARDDLTRAEGFRTMVVLSDGVDNRLARDKTYNPDKLPAGEVLRQQFAGTGIAVHVVGFQVASKEEEEHRKQFEVVAKLSPRGSVSTVARVDDLIRALERLTAPDLFWRLANRRGRSPLYEASRDGGDDRWVRAAADRYRLEVTTGWPLSQRLLLRDGDRLLLRLYSAGRDPACERLLYSLQEPFLRRPARTLRDWRVAVLQNQFGDREGLQMLTSLERAPRPGEEVVRQVSPGDVWLEVDAEPPSTRPEAIGRPVEGGGVAALAWSEVAGYPAPCWGVDVPAWPGEEGTPRAPRLGVWWAPDEAPARGLRRTEHWKRRTDLVGDWDVLGETVHVDGVTVEERTVQVRPGVREPRWCLVVRATHESGRPVWVRLRGLNRLAGQEHRHYDAGRYAGLFWFANLDTRDQLEQAADEDLAAIEVVSVSALKREAERRQYHARFGDLDAPATLLGRPTPLPGDRRAR